MKIRIIRAADHRVSSGVSQHFTAGAIVSVPRATAAALVGKGVAEVVEAAGEPQPGSEEKTHADR